MANDHMLVLTLPMPDDAPVMITTLPSMLEGKSRLKSHEAARNTANAGAMKMSKRTVVGSSVTLRMGFKISMAAEGLATETNQFPRGWNKQLVPKENKNGDGTHHGRCDEFGLHESSLHGSP